MARRAAAMAPERGDVWRCHSCTPDHYLAHSGLQHRPKRDILDALDLLSISKLVLTNDSGLMHVTAALGTPMVALYGPTSPTYTPPLSDSARLIKKFSGFSKKRVGDRADGYDKSLYEISPEEVKEALNDLL